MTVEPDGQAQPEAFGRREVFRRELRVAVRYERGLVLKALAVLVAVAVIVVLRVLYFA